MIMFKKTCFKITEIIYEHMKLLNYLIEFLQCRIELIEVPRLFNINGI